jgi:hypothetical protein
VTVVARTVTGVRLATILLATVLVAGCGGSGGDGPRATAAPPVAAGALAVPAPLTDDGLPLRAGPVAVPLELQMPSLRVAAPMVGVGMSDEDVMDAPMGPAQDPVWQQAFWYRGSAVPGQLSTALIAGHVDDPLGRPAAFARIGDLRPGDPIVVHDTRSGLDVRFAVTGSETYTLDQTTETPVLTDIYGAGPVAGTSPQPSSDGLSHLTLITCAGTFRNGTHDHRLVVYATRVS